MLNSEEKSLIEFVQDFSSAIPVQKRIKVFRAMAHYLNVDNQPEHCRVFLNKAAILEEAERRCEELNFHTDGHAGKDGV